MTIEDELLELANLVAVFRVHFRGRNWDQCELAIARLQDQERTVQIGVRELELCLKEAIALPERARKVIG